VTPPERHLCLKQLRRLGTPAVAEVLEMTTDKIEFGAVLVRVRYAFDADGRRRLGTDRVIPSATQQFEVGSAIRILYLPDGDYASVIIGLA